MCVYIYIYINRMLLYHCVTSSTYFQHLLFLFKLFYSLFSKKKKKKNLLPISPHYYTSSNISPPSLPIYLPTILYFVITFLSLFYLSYIFYSSFPYIILYKFGIIYPIQSILLIQKIQVLSLSLSLSHNSNLG